MIEMTLPLNTWKRFVKDGVLDSSRINRRIMESWYRCRDANVNPYLEKGQYVLSEEQLLEQKNKNPLLLDIATPYLDNLKKIVEELGMIALLCDKEGYVLSMLGHKGVIQQAKKINFVQGVRWNEEDVGTNAIGTALKIQEPVMVNGAEHFSVASHKWSCSASPIRNPQGKIIGILDISCPIDRTHPYMLGMVSTVAYSIERDFQEYIYKNEIELMQRTIDIVESEQPLIVCNSEGKVVSANHTIRKAVPQWYGMELHEVLEYGFHINMEVPLFSKKNVVLGKNVYLTEKKKTKPSVSFCVNKQNVKKNFYFDGVTGTSQTFKKVLEEVERVAPTDASVYIYGESGTGKELIAKSIHENSLRKTGPFIALNCGAIPSELLESELFGYAEGAFTGARRNGYKGKLEQANNGTLFLDEIGEIPHNMQVALLRVLQERKVVPLGGTKEIPVNIRIITATHRNLVQLVKEGKFRKDLFYRLHVYPINLPPLRQRKEDIPYFVKYFCEQRNFHFNLSTKCFEILMKYEWPGNIRELINVLERLYIWLQGKNLKSDVEIIKWLEDNLLSEFNALESQNEKTNLTIREKIQKESMIEALLKTNGNVSKAAKLLEVPRSTFYKRMKKFNL